MSEEIPENYDPLWGDGGPYSEVTATRQTRIMDDYISREFYYVHANINPATYEVLEKYQKDINDSHVDAFLMNSEFVDWKEGYRWYVYQHEIIDDSIHAQVELSRKNLIEVITKFHVLAMEYLEI